MTAAPGQSANEPSQSNRVSDKARNEKQKSVLLQEVARLGRQRSSRAVEELRKTCERVQDLQASRSIRQK